MEFFYKFFYTWNFFKIKLSYYSLEKIIIEQIKISNRTEKKDKDKNVSINFLLIIVRLKLKRVSYSKRKKKN